MYSKKVLQHFMHPKNQGRIKNPDGVGMVGNPSCGDIMTVYIKVKKPRKASPRGDKASPRGDKASPRGDKASPRGGDEIISDIKFETLGCAAAIATSSMVTEMAKGKKLDEAVKITRSDVARGLEGLPPAKMHCSNLAEEALKRAIEDYRSKGPERTQKSARSKRKTRRR